MRPVGQAVWPMPLARRRASPYIGARNRQPEPHRIMGKLFFHAGVFLFITFLVWLACQRLIKYDEARDARTRDRAL